MYMAVTKPLLSPDRLVGVANALGRDRGWVRPSVVVAACLHGGVALVLPRFDQAARAAEASTEMIDVERANPPRPLPDPEPPPALVAEPREARSTTAAKGTTPSAAAQAGRILAREPSPDEPLDLTGFVEGVGATYAGGTTRADGTQTHAVRERVAPAEVSGARSGAHDRSSRAGANLSRRARIAGDSNWRCPFPPEATEIDEASVELHINYDSAGQLRGVEVTRDPGHGFGREASRCVLDKAWQPALDAAGAAIAGTSAVLVRFVR